MPADPLTNLPRHGLIIGFRVVGFRVLGFRGFGFRVWEIDLMPAWTPSRHCHSCTLNSETDAQSTGGFL